MNRYAVGNAVECLFYFASRPLTSVEEATFQSGGGLPAGVGLDQPVVLMDWLVNGGPVTTVSGVGIIHDAPGAYHGVVVTTQAGFYEYRGYSQDGQGNPLASGQAGTFEAVAFVVAPSGARHVVSFEDVYPPERFPPVLDPWVSVRIEEAADLAGAWVGIETIVLDPPDRKPKHPRRRSVSSENGTLAEGWNRLVWVDAAGDEERGTPRFHSGGVTIATWAPTVQDVADLSPAYTRHPVDGSGQQAGAAQKVFDDTTNPTATDVQALIAVAVQEVSGRVAVSVERMERFPDLARRAAAWHAAMTIEAEKEPERAAEVVGVYAWKQSSYVACLKELTAQARVPFVA